MVHTYNHVTWYISRRQIRTRGKECSLSLSLFSSPLAESFLFYFILFYFYSRPALRKSHQHRTDCCCVPPTNPPPLPPPRPPLSCGGTRGRQSVRRVHAATVGLHNDQHRIIHMYVHAYQNIARETQSKKTKAKLETVQRFEQQKKKHFATENTQEKKGKPGEEKEKLTYTTTTRGSNPKHSSTSKDSTKQGKGDGGQLTCGARGCLLGGGDLRTGPWNGPWNGPENGLRTGRWNGLCPCPSTSPST